MNDTLINALGDELYVAAKECRALEPLTSRHADLTVDDAYRIQQRVNARRIEAGERMIGKKIGVTSQVVMDMLGVYQPDFGMLSDAMLYREGEAIPAASLIQPKAEGEIAFVLRHDLQGPGVSVADVLAATAGVMACFEIVDSRIRDWKIRIQDTVADNASCGVFVIGAARVAPRALDLAAVKMDILKNGAHIASGTGAAVQGHPATAVAWLANTLGRFGIPFLAGEIILSGSLAPLLPITPGDRFDMSLTGIGTASISFEA